VETSFTWIVTRAEPEARRTVALLRSNKLHARALPCIERHWRPTSEWCTPAPANRRAVWSVLLVTSSAIAERVEVADAVFVSALGPVTAAALRVRGVRVDLEVHGGVQALAEELRRIAQANDLQSEQVELRYPTSDYARDQPEHVAATAALRQVGQLTVAEAYRTTPARDLDGALGALRTELGDQPCGWVFASPSAVAAFARGGGFKLAAPRGVVSIGSSTRRAWREHKPAAWPDGDTHLPSEPLPKTLLAIEARLQ
jgi:uroporphyrinogen-III synthase